MTPAARVRRDFTRGRPPKLVEGDMEPKHRAVVWRKAAEALADARQRMTDAKLDPRHIEADIVFVVRTAPDVPEMIAVEWHPNSAGAEQRPISPAEWEAHVLDVIGKDEVIVLGMIFTQLDLLAGDAGRGQIAYFPLLFTGLNARGMGVLRAAAEGRKATNEIFVTMLTGN